MCYFITIGIKKDFVTILFDHIQGKYVVKQSGNPSIMQHFSAEDIAFEIVTGSGLMIAPCSCSLFSAPQEKPELPEASKLRLKYRKKGWSADKIDRAISEKLSVTHKRNFEGLKPDLRERLCRVAADAGRISLIIHWYTGDTQTEIVPIKVQRVVKCDELLHQAGAITEDIAIKIIP